ncbi:MAG: DNA polymerase/3'-5' exonuclease PolX [Balneolaceae bacterium]|nr:DNA polymerase/3'-5' exonuclease PolX [Balneolaceae bacterium]
MSVTNEEIATQLYEIGKLLQLAGENRFRVIAFERAAQTVEALDEDINVYIENDNLTDIKGIGSSIANDIKSYAETGSIEVLEKLREEIPQGIRNWLKISGLGPKTIRKIHEELGISTTDELREACKDGRVAGLEGLGKKSAENILKSIEWRDQFSDRVRLDEATELGEVLLQDLDKIEGVLEIALAGSLRRAKETIGDVDLLVGAEKEDIDLIFDAFVNHNRAAEVLGRGDTKSSIRTVDGRQADLRIVEPGKFPAALLYFTGSKEHNVVMRQRARNREMALNEYGLFELTEEGDTDFNRPVDYRSESDIYRHLDLHFIPPELREDRGEFEHFEQQESLNLVEEGDIRGVIHAHSTWSDGRFSIRRMAEACIERGYEYLGISDHSQTAAYAGGLTPDDVKAQWEEIDRLNEEFEENGEDFRIFKGIESDILGDGSLDYEDALLEQFDFVIASVHQGMDMPREKMMERFRNAIRHPLSHIIGHPTGRLLLQREESDLEMNELIELAAEHNTAIEINANPKRLDLDWRHGNKAREMGLLSSVNPDAHGVESIDYIRYGVRIARKGKFNPERILNTRSAGELDKWFKMKK